LFDLKPGQVYGPVLPPPIFIRLGQSVLHATGSVGPSDGPLGSPAIWEGHALALEPDRERSRTVFFYVQGDDLRRVTLQIDDQAVVAHALHEARRRLRLGEDGEAFGSWPSAWTSRRVASPAAPDLRAAVD
jgi:hypothetical protein